MVVAQTDSILHDTQKGKGTAADTSGQIVRIQGKEVHLPGTNKFPAFSASVTALLQTLRSVIIGPSMPRDPKDSLITVVPSLLEKVLNFFSISPSLNFLKSLTLIDMDHDAPFLYILMILICWSI